MHKTFKFVTLLSLSTLILFACSDEKEKTVEKETQTETSFQGIDFQKIYEMNDNETLVTMGKEKLTVGEVKQKTFEQSLLTAVNQFIDTNLLTQKYTVSKEELEAEINRQKEAMGESFNADTIDEKSIRYQLAYNKAITELVKFTDEDLKNIYKQYYEGKDARTFDEMKEEIEKQAPYILGGQKIYELQNELRKDAKIDFNEESLKQQFNLSVNPVVTPTVDEPKEETKEEKPSN